MCLSRPSRRVENSFQECSTCWSRVFSAVGSSPSSPYLRRSSWVKAVPLVRSASNNNSCPGLLSDTVGPSSRRGRLREPVYQLFHSDPGTGEEGGLLAGVPAGVGGAQV